MFRVEWRPEKPERWYLSEKRRFSAQNFSETERFYLWNGRALVRNILPNAEFATLNACMHGCQQARMNVACSQESTIRTHSLHCSRA